MRDEGSPCSKLQPQPIPQIHPWIAGCGGGLLVYLPVSPRSNEIVLAVPDVPALGRARGIRQ